MRPINSAENCRNFFEQYNRKEWIFREEIFEILGIPRDAVHFFKNVGNIFQFNTINWKMMLLSQSYKLPEIKIGKFSGSNRNDSAFCRSSESSSIRITAVSRSKFVSCC